MTDQPSPDLSAVRKKIDRVDQALLDLIAERLALSSEVRRAKAGAKLWRPAREDSHVADLIGRAQASGTQPALVSRVWAELMSASISVQGNTRLHVALEGDARANLSLIRDRFGGSLPVLSYPTSSAAIAACAGDPEGICVLPSPGGMVNWWTALAPGGAADSLRIVAALPRVDPDDWPQAVAIADIGPDPQEGGRTLVVADRDDSPGGTVRAQSGSQYLIELAPGISPGERPIIGYLPAAIRAG